MDENSYDLDAVYMIGSLILLAISVFISAWALRTAKAVREDAQEANKESSEASSIANSARIDMSQALATLVDFCASQEKSKALRASMVMDAIVDAIERWKSSHTISEAGGREVFTLSPHYEHLLETVSNLNELIPVEFRALLQPALDDLSTDFGLKQVEKTRILGRLNRVISTLNEVTFEESGDETHA